MDDVSPPLGIVEGYFGKPWSWDERAHVVRTLAPHGYSRFIYAPKGDAHLRRDWTVPHDPSEAAAIGSFAKLCQQLGVEFGIGLTPFELHADWNAAGRRKLIERTGRLLDLGPVHIALLFDDMRGDFEDLAAVQADMAAAVAETHQVRMSICPSYYSDDPVLDRVFGHRPKNYLQDLGRGLPDEVGLFWTGPEVCSREISVGHMDRVARQMGRKPLLWDNYPVNDGPRMSNHLHLRGFTGRSGIGALCAGHFINPALQPNLSLLPAVTLAMAYRQGDTYDYLAATHAAAALLYPKDVGDALMADLLSLQDAGRERLNRERLLQKYAAFDHPAAQEVRQFLQGYYSTSAEEVQTQ
jgi:hypothetical protein